MKPILRSIILIVGLVLLSGCRREEPSLSSGGPSLPTDPEAILAKGGSYWSSTRKVIVKTGGKEKEVGGGDHYFIWPADPAAPAAKAGYVTLRLHWKLRGDEASKEIFAWMSTEGELKDDESTYSMSAWDPSVSLIGREGDVNVSFNLQKIRAPGDVNMLVYLAQGPTMLSNVLHVRVNFP